MFSLELVNYGIKYVYIIGCLGVKVYLQISESVLNSCYYSIMSKIKFLYTVLPVLFVI